MILPEVLVESLALVIDNAHICTLLGWSIHDNIHLMSSIRDSIVKEPGFGGYLETFRTIVQYSLQADLRADGFSPVFRRWIPAL